VLATAGTGATCYTVHSKPIRFVTENNQSINYIHLANAHTIRVHYVHITKSIAMGYQNYEQPYK